MIDNVEAIRSIASEARHAFEERTVSRDLLSGLYLSYNPSFRGDIVRFLDFRESIFPKANCGLTAVYLKHLFNEGKIVEGEYYLEPHQFLSIGKLVVDITADQFDGPPVYVGPLEFPWRADE
jgi:hypothetical protein